MARTGSHNRGVPLVVMMGDVQVVEDGTDDPRRDRGSPGPSWLWLSIGFLVGVGLAVVFFTAGATPALDSVDDAAFADPEATTATTVESSPTTVPQPEGVAETIPGFPDTLVAAVWAQGDNMSYLTWPLTGPPIMAPLPGFSAESVRFDRSGRMMAIGAEVADSDEMLLSAGTSFRVRPIATDVSGFAWHDSAPARLAYTQQLEEGWRLSVVGTSSVPEVLIESDGDIQGTVAAWGDWGLALQDESSVTLLTPAGRLKARVEGVVLDSDPDGWLVMSDPGLKLVSAGGGVKLLDVDPGLIGEVEAARISPDGTKLAIAGNVGHLVVPLDGGGEAIASPVTSGFDQIGWTSDSRFVIGPSLRGIVIIDTEGDGRTQVVLPRQAVAAVSTLPLGGA